MISINLHSNPGEDVTLCMTSAAEIRTSRVRKVGAVAQELEPGPACLLGVIILLPEILRIRGVSKNNQVCWFATEMRV